jgi:hypothetical protein
LRPPSLHEIESPAGVESDVRVPIAPTSEARPVDPLAFAPTMMVEDVSAVLAGAPTDASLVVHTPAPTPARARTSLLLAVAALGGALVGPVGWWLMHRHAPTSNAPTEVESSAPTSPTEAVSPPDPSSPSAAPSAVVTPAPPISTAKGRKTPAPPAPKKKLRHK